MYNSSLETKFDKLLHIRTTGRDDSESDQYYYPYEPTPYSVLERLANTGMLHKNNTLLDYGCGKGRVDFYLSWQTRCHSIGIEYNERIHQTALCNKETCICGNRVDFKLTNAETYAIPSTVDRIYFFNPFSLEILHKVISRILESYYTYPRHILLFFYYPSDEYVAYLMTINELTFSDEIDCKDLFSGNNPREKILIFEMSF